MLFMKVIRVLAGLLVIICFGIGTLMSARDEQAFGHTLVLAAASSWPDCLLAWK